MGNNNNRSSEQKLETEHDKLKYYYPIYDYNSKKSNMEFRFLILNEQKFHQWEIDIKKIHQSKQQALLLPVKYQKIEGTLCGTGGYVDIQFECYQYTLYESIKNRKNNNVTFTEQELWYLLLELTISSRVFQVIGKKSGDIRPKNILLNEKGQLKLINRCSFPFENTNYLKALQQKQSVYLAPEQLQQIQTGLVSSSVDQAVAESFSIGLTILDSGLLTDCEYLFDMKFLTFRNNIFRESLIRWRNSQYSSFLIRTVENMLDINNSQRPTPGEIHAIIEPYEEQIRSFKKFIPNKELSKYNLQKYQEQGQKGERTNNIRRLKSRSMVSSEQGLKQRIMNSPDRSIYQYIKQKR